jgi:hypothetical protein
MLESVAVRKKAGRPKGGDSQMKRGSQWKHNNSSRLLLLCLTVVVLSCISLPKHTTPKNLKPCRDYLVKKYQAEASSAVVIYGEEIGVWIDNSKTVTTQAEASHAGVEILYYLESHCPDCCSANHIWIYFRKISRCLGLTYKMTSTPTHFPFECKQNADDSNGAVRPPCNQHDQVAFGTNQRKGEHSTR